MLIADPWLAFVAIGTAFLTGGMLVFGQKLLPTVKEHVKLTDDQQFRLNISFTFVLIFCMIIGGWFVDFFGIRDSLIFGTFLISFGLSTLALSTNVQGATFATVVLGVATAFLHLSSAMLFPHAFFSPEHAPAAMNIGYFFVGLGYLGFPPLASWFVRILSFRKGILLIALLGILCACGAAFTSHDFPTPETDTSISAVFSDYRLWLTAAVMFLFYGVETGLNNWTPHYLSDVRVTETTKELLIAGFWIFFLGSRFAAGISPKVFGSLWFLLGLAVLTGILVGNLSGAFQRYNASIGFLALAACLGPIFPSAIGEIFIFFPSHTANYLGVILGIGLIARFVVFPFTKGSIEKTAVRKAMLTTAVFSFIMAFCLLTLILLQGIQPE